jgi:hypothetical protein
VSEAVLSHVRTESPERAVAAAAVQVHPQEGHRPVPGE